ncbi:MAG: TolC family protein [Saprospiraceae bacterium]|nr:TolC family protein [Saprospiraceae bacterium]MCB9344009.1 TolC family protein [Lewinellaceae bacterium]
MQMKCMLALVITVVFSGLQAQQTNYDAIVQPIEAKARDFSEYLVQLAWLNSPENAVLQDELLNSRSANKNIRKEWMRDVQASFNINESNLRGADTLGNVFFPRYNFGVMLNLYNIISQPEKSKIGARQVRIAEQRINQLKLKTRSETLQAWATFRLAREILKERALVEQELNNNFILIQQLYKSDEKTLEEYTTASAAYYQARESRIRAEAEQELAKFKLEEIVGLKWEQIEHPKKEE